MRKSDILKGNSSNGDSLAPQKADQASKIFKHDTLNAAQDRSLKSASIKPDNAAELPFPDTEADRAKAPIDLQEQVGEPLDLATSAADSVSIVVDQDGSGVLLYSPSDAAEFDPIQLAQQGSASGAAGLIPSFDSGTLLGALAGVGALAAIAGSGGGGNGAPAAVPSQITDFKKALDAGIGSKTTADVAPVVSDSSYTFRIAAAATKTAPDHLGFDRDQLPLTTAQIRAQLYDFSDTTSDASTIDGRGISVAIEDGVSGVGVRGYIRADATTDAGVPTSRLVWLENVDISRTASSTGDSSNYLYVEADSHAGSDAEVGIANLAMNIGGTAVPSSTANVDASFDAYANAHDGSKSAVYLGSANIAANVSVSESAYASVFASARLHTNAVGQSEAKFGLYDDLVVSASVLLATSDGGIDGSGDATAFARVDVSADNRSTTWMGIDGDISVTAAAMNDADEKAGSASAQLEILRAYASDASAAQLEVAGNIHVASAGGDATARLGVGYQGGYSSGSYQSSYQGFYDGIKAYARDGSGASVSVGGGVMIQASGSSIANAQLGDVSANADNGAAADVTVADGVMISAKGDVAIARFANTAEYADIYTGSGYSAYTSHTINQGIESVASDGSSASVSVGGDITVEASGTSYGEAKLGTLYVSAQNGSAAGLSIAGDLTVSAVGDVAIARLGHSYYSQATSSYWWADYYSYNSSETGLNLYASNGSLASYAVGGDLTVQASGSSYAEAELNNINARAYDGSVAEASIAGDVSVIAAGDVAIAHFGNFSSSYATNYAYATDTYSWFSSYTGIYAYATGGSSTSVSIGGGVTVEALGGIYGEAQLNSFAVRAYNSSTADLTVAGDVTVRAVGDTAVAKFGGYYTYNVDYDTPGRAFYSHSSYSGLEVTAYNASSASLSIGGGVTVEAVGSSFANAQMNDVSAYAYGGAAADLSVAGDILISATGGVAIAGLGNAYSSSQTAVSWAGEYSYYGSYAGIEADARSNSSVSISVGGGVTIEASGTTYAKAHLNDVSGYAYNTSTAEVSIAGDVVVSAAGDVAIARFGNDFSSHATGYYNSWDTYTSSSSYAGIESGARYSSSSSVSIGGGVMVQALGSTYAEAQLNGVSAYAYRTSTADVSIAEDIVVSASGDVAIARLGNSDTWNVAYDAAPKAYYSYGSYSGIESSASYGSSASVSIGGGVTVEALGSSRAEAQLNDVSAYAYSSGTADVIIAGDVTVSAIGDVAIAGLGNFYGSQATLYWPNTDYYSYQSSYAGIEAYARYDSSASVSVGGGVSIEASGTSYAESELNEVSAFASSSGTVADVSIAGDVTISAVGDMAIARLGGAKSSYGTGYLSASDYYDYYADGVGIAATAYYESSASVSIGGGLTVQAAGSSYAEAQLNGISAYAAHTSSTANISVAQGVTVSAVGDVAIATLGGQSSYFYATVSGSTKSAAYTNYYGGIEAYASQSASAVVSIGGGVAVDASGVTYAEASINEIRAYAGDSGSAAVYIEGGVTVSAQASATSSEDALALAGLQISADTALSATSAYVSIAGDVRVAASAVVSAQGTSDTYMYVPLLSASVDVDAGAALQINASGLGSIDIDGGVYVSADAAVLTKATATADAYALLGISAADSAHISITGDVELHQTGDVGGAYVSILASGTSGSVDIGGDVVIEVSSSALLAVTMSATAGGSITVGGDILISGGNNAQLMFNGAGIDAEPIYITVGDSGLIDFNYTPLDSNDTTASAASFAVLGLGTSANYGVDLEGNVFSTSTADLIDGSGLSWSALFTSLSSALTGSKIYAYATYTGTSDITGDGVGDQGTMVIAYNDVGADAGVDYLVFVQNVTTA